jgi:hypothetical protein
MWFPNLEMAEREAKEIAAAIRSKLGVERVTVCIRDHHKHIQKELIDSS